MKLWQLLRFHPTIWVKGILMGMADLIPGVSGGTVALITGIYEKLIFSIGAIGKNSLTCLWKGRIACFWNRINGNFLLSLGAGILTSVLLFSKLITFLLQHFPIPLWSFFSGLILASIIFILKESGKIRLSSIPFFIIGAASAYWVTSLAPEHHSPSRLFIFLSGAIASTAMILPGISGSYILVILGMYAYILNAVNQRRFAVLLIFSSGVVGGLLLFSRFLKWLFAHHPHITLFTLAGFMAGSLNKVWPWKKILKTATVNGKEMVLESLNIAPWHYEDNPQFLWAVTMFLTGMLLVFVLEKTTENEEK